MRSRIALAVLVVGLAAVDWPIAALPHWPIAEAQLTEIVPTQGMVITANTRVKPGTYRLSGRDGSAAITVRGSNITVDMTGVVLEGGEPFADPDGYVGTGIEINGGDHVTVKGATIRGYKTAILARKSPFLHLTGNDLSYNWKQRLWSGIEKESLVDWMSYHNNEKDEWLRFGAAIYLSECDDAEVDHNRAVQGQNGLMITRSARLKIWNNTFSYLSSVGLGMYRTTDSMVAHNKLDYAVRGYSHGFYFRGQDSTGILMYEQSSRNTFHHNSATHGGDGLFLWAGQSTMDTGQGGANDNVFFANDFSHAVANGIEATFSRNQFINNRIEDCWHGVWGGYSFDSVFYGNTFANNDEAIAIEHGQNIAITNNTFKGDKVALRLWSNATQDPNWGYPKTRDTRSRDYTVTGNTFEDQQTVLDVSRTSGLLFRMNALRGTIGALIKNGIGVEGLRWDAAPTEGITEIPGNPGPVFLQWPNGMRTQIPAGTPRGRSTIIVDEWGPYDYKSPKVWPVGKTTDRPLKLRVMGPKGTWKLVSARGGTSSAKAGATGDQIVITIDPGNTDLRLEFEYLGDEVVDPRGRRTPAGQPHRFVYEQFEPAIAWNARWWSWADYADPLKAPDDFERRLRDTPTLSATVPRFDLISGRTLVEGLPNDRLALRAEGEVRLPPGNYDLVTITDDGIRVWVDDRLVLERWDIHESSVDRVPLTGGRHRLRLEYFESTGWAELKVKIVRR
jgi:nitrous oxidase accessory protein NosD